MELVLQKQSNQLAESGSRPIGSFGGGGGGSGAGGGMGNLAQELMDFINNLTSEQFGKIQSFFDTMPKLTHTVNYNCPVCNKAHTILLEGMQSFF